MDERPNPPLRWGILGTGWVADMFVSDLALLPDAAVVAVGSRTTTAADAFADRFGIAGRHGSYEALVADPEVDVVHVATPHPFHLEHALLAIDAGKHVLVEKPFTLDAAQARTLVDAARASDVFVMEAMWTRFLPHVVAIRELLAAGALGEVVTVTADHGQFFTYDAAHRLFAAHLGGGALLDLGVYPVSFAAMVLGAPTEVVAIGDLTDTGVDAQTSVLLRHAGGAHAVLTSTSRAASARAATVVGTEARIEVDPVFYEQSAFSVVARDETVVRHEFARAGRGMQHQAVEFARCVRAGLRESPVMSLDESLAVMGTLDEIRRQIGVTYPP